MDYNSYLIEKYDLSSFNPENNASTSSTTPLLSWKCKEKEVGYHLQLSTSQDFTSLLVDDKTLTESSYQVNTPLERNTFYYWRIRINAKNDKGEEWSTVLRFYIVGVLINEGFENNDGTFSTSNHWVLGGDALPFVQNTNVHNGSWAAQFGDISDYDESYFETTVYIDSAMTIYFWARVESETCCDRLRFYIDDIQPVSTATNTWTEFSVPVTSGTHVLKWMYRKDGSVSTGADTAWVDDITLF